MIELGEADYVAPHTATVAIEQILGGVEQEAGLVIPVKWAQSHPPATAQRSGGAPIVGL